MYFRKNPFGGEYTVFAGLEECVRFIANFKLTEEQIDYIKDNLSVSCEVNVCDTFVSVFDRFTLKYFQ